VAGRSETEDGRGVETNAMARQRVYSGAAVNARLTLAYVGTRYAGWQRQADAPTVQQVLEEALGRLSGQPVTVIGAGRTDAGVHAEGQVASATLGRVLPVSALVHGTNSQLPEDVRVLDAAMVDAAFHARRSALAKTYRYRLYCGRPVPPALAPFVVAAPERLDPERLAAATRALVGRHDFAAFALAGGAPGPTVRRIFAAAWESAGPELRFGIVGEGFLRGMVRSLVGTLLEVGAGSRTPADFAALLAGGARSAAGPTAPARGLCLERVDYAPAAAGEPPSAAVD
jgi:tRNA pseudouridine38-40 synthase